jgi:hypothetical protein
LQNLGLAATFGVCQESRPYAASGDVALPKELLVWLSKWQETLWSGLRSATTRVTVQTAAVYEIIADMFLRSKEAI